MSAKPRTGAEDMGFRVSAADQSEALEVAKRRAVGVVVRRSVGADDCRDLLGMLGLEKAAGLPVTMPGSEPAAASGNAAPAPVDAPVELDTQAPVELDTPAADDTPAPNDAAAVLDAPAPVDTPAR